MIGTFTTMPASVERELTESSLTREQLVLQIQMLNPTATPAILTGFSARSLGLYLAHLRSALEPRRGGAGWLRPAETPAIVGFAADDES